MYVQIILYIRAYKDKYWLVTNCDFYVSTGKARPYVFGSSRISNSKPDLNIFYVVLTDNLRLIYLIHETTKCKRPNVKHVSVK